MKQYTLLTANGINKLLKTASNGSKITLKEVVVSDFDGELSESITTIPNEKYRGAINAITINESDSNILDVDAIIPPDVGGFCIKTAGIFCDDGSLFAVARLADTYKPLLSEGSSKDITLSFRLQIANANDSIVLKVDNNIVLATRKWSDATFLKKTDKIDAYTKRESDEKFALKTELTDGLPIGAYLSYPSQKTIPAGFLTCDGRSLKKEEYAELFDVIGYTYGGSGDNFNLPNFADGKFMRSIGGNAATLGASQQDAFQGHYHNWKDNPSLVGWAYTVTGNTSNRVGTRNNETPIAEPKSDGVNGEPRTANETRPYNMAVVVIIKAKNVNTPTAGQIDKTILATETKAGITKLKNSITAKQEDAAVTEKAVSDFMDANKGIGVGQTWQDVLAQRKGEVLYTNTTGRPIMVSITADSSSAAINRVALYVGDVRLARFENVNGLATQLCAIVPDKKTYQLKSEINASIVGIIDWVELR
ncbi:phage tail protein [Campylobacter concisus]|uniref:phage tail-collar fiber domain-containing protein n=1 Tax=Campylobacter concisus TaxID=199 RepID=UPI000CD949B9|nr:phage tail protein [Campylobacter concisus]